MEDKSRHPMDELFRNKLNEDQPASDDSLWGEVESVLDSRKKKRRFLILMWTVLLMAGLTTGGYFMVPNKSASTVYSSGVPQNDISSTNTVNNQTATANPGQTAISSQANVGAVSNSNNSSSNSSDKLNNPTNSNDNLNTTSSKSNITGARNTAKASSASARRSMAVSEKHKSSASAVQGSKATSSDFPSESLASAQTDKTNAGIKPDSTNNNVDIGVPTINANSYLKGNVTSSDDELADTSEKKPEVAVSDELKKPQKPAHKSLMKWYVEVDGAYMYNAHFVGAPTGVTSNYDNIRGSDEKPLLTPNYMFKVGFVRKNLQLNTGIGITNLGEKVAYKNHTDSTGNQIIQNGSVFKQNGTYVNEYVTVPLQVALLIPVKGVRLQLGGGVAGSVPLRWNSYYLNKQVNGLEDPGSLKEINKFVLNFNFTFGVEVPFTRHWAALANFEYYRDLTSVFKSSYGVKQEYLGPGGSLGIRYTFAR